jgi:hypothetical protein
MILQPSLLSLIPIVVGVGILVLAVGAAIYDTREAKRNAKQVAKPEPSFPKAA